MSEIKEIAFLKEYEKLCRKHGLCLDSCGCCGSPFISDFDKDENLKWMKSKICFKEVCFEEIDEFIDGIFYIDKDGNIKEKKEVVE